RTVQVHLVSRDKTKKVGETNALVITTRQLCCGDDSLPKSPLVADVVTLTDRHQQAFAVNQRRFMAAPYSTARRAERVDHSSSRASPIGREATPALPEPGIMPARVANDLSATIKD